MPIKIEELTDVLLAAGVKDQSLRTAILKEAQELENQKKAEREEDKIDGPKAKNKHVFFVRKDEKGNYSEAGFCAKVPQDSDNNTLLERIQKASAMQNDKPKSKRGRKGKGGKIEKYYDFFHGIKREYSKSVSIAPLKELVEIIILPSEEIDFSK